MFKTKFGDGIHAKKERSQFNETLPKILCHIVVVVIRAMRETDIDPGFRSDTKITHLRRFSYYPDFT